MNLTQLVEEEVEEEKHSAHAAHEENDPGRGNPRGNIVGVRSLQRDNLNVTSSILTLAHILTGHLRIRNLSVLVATA